MKSPPSPSVVEPSLWIDLRQPITAQQLARKTGQSMDRCAYVLTKLAARGLMRCLNPDSRRSRVFWLTSRGSALQRKLRTNLGLPPLQRDVPDVNWSTYGQLCYAQRALVLKVLTEPMQPAQIKRVARAMYPAMQMSANNCRDVIRVLWRHGVVQRVRARKRAHWRYELTNDGQHFRRLLLQADLRQ